MKTIEKKEKVQREALKQWIKAGKHGTCEIVTGLGKTFIALHALYTMPRDKEVIHLFLAEVKDRKNTLMEEIRKYNLIFNRDVLNDYNLQFACYQKACKLSNRKVGLVIADEIHDSLTPTYSKFYFNNTYDAVLGLSAKIKQTTHYIVGNKYINKGAYLKKIAPICYTYSLKDSLKDDTSRKLNIHVIEHSLDTKYKFLEFVTPKGIFKTTEHKSYNYWQNRLDNSIMLPTEAARDREFNLCRQKRSSLLYSLPSKIRSTKLLLSNLKSKSIIFGNSIDSLLKVTPNVVSSYNNNDQNDAIKRDFNNNVINNIAGFKKLKQGENLLNLDNCIVMSYYSNSEDLLQRIGRLRDTGEIGNIFIFVTKYTQEQLWFNKMINYYVGLADIIYYKNLEECLEKIN